MSVSVSEISPKAVFGPGAADEHRGRAAHHRRAHEHGVHCIGHILPRIRQIAEKLFDGIGFAGQERLLHKEILCRQHPSIAGYQVARGK